MVNHMLRTKTLFCRVKVLVFKNVQSLFVACVSDSFLKKKRKEGDVVWTAVLLSAASLGLSTTALDSHSN